jgi:UDP-N-acetylmuramate: L-alanyl-gamma-D-glutamyl-meso-diaminopimelate ligase
MNFGVSARLGEGREFVIEADEYDTAFFDKRSKFIHYRPRTLGLNNLELDHADLFDDLAASERQFHHVVRTVPSSGCIVVNDLEESLARVLAQGCWSQRRGFGSAVSDFTAQGDASDFEVQCRGASAGRVTWPLSGVHNQLNALAAIAAADHVGVPPAEAARHLCGFQNVRRRMDERGRVAVPGGEVTVLDDFAHHPTAIRTTVDGLRRQLDAAGKKMPPRSLASRSALPPGGAVFSSGAAQRKKTARILAVFEPRSNTMKLGAMKSQLPWALEHADLSFCHAGGLDWNAAEALAPLGARAQVAASVDEIVQQVCAAARAGDYVLCMSNGGFGGVHQRLLHALAKK